MYMRNPVLETIEKNIWRDLARSFFKRLVFLSAVSVLAILVAIKVFGLQRIVAAEINPLTPLTAIVVISFLMAWRRR